MPLSRLQLLADCYYVNGQRNRTYREAVNAVFGRKGDIILGEPPWGEVMDCTCGRRLAVHLWFIMLWFAMYAQITSFSPSASAQAGSSIPVSALAADAIKGAVVGMEEETCRLQRSVFTPAGARGPLPWLTAPNCMPSWL